jgi:hypothetical protein
VISLGARFADYGLTGGFFLLVSLALFGWLLPAEACSLVSSLKIALGSNTFNAPTILGTFIAGVFAAAFIVVVFFLGLLLDLLGSMVMWERKIFRKELRRGKQWMNPVLNMYEEFLGKDFERLIEGKERWYERIFRRRRLLGRYSRVQSIILWHILLRVEPAKLEILSDQFRLCRVAGAIASGLFVSVCGVIVISVGYLLGVELEPKRLTIGTLFSLLLLELSFFLTVRTYSRYCLNLFSLLFSLSKTDRSGQE